MVKSYWGKVCRRAWAETAVLLGLDTWAHVMVRALFITVIIVALLVYGSADSAADHAVERTAILLTILVLTPLVFAWKVVTVPARMAYEETAGIKFVARIKALEIDVERLKFQLDPEAVKRSPTYVRLKFWLDPEKGSMSPKDAMNMAKAEFDKLFDKALTGDFEAFFIATYVAEWTRDYARKFAASGEPFQEMQVAVSAKLEKLHEYFQSLSSAAR
jgi:hypothetical protein